MAIDSSQRTEGQQLSSEEIEVILNDLEQRLDRLKILYEQYFMGIEKLEPQVLRKEVTRIFNQLNKMQIRNTGLRFRFRTIVQRWNLYITRWNRILREIENGTYERDVLRAQRNMAKRGAEFPAEELGIKRRRRRDAAAADAAADGPAADENALVMEADEPPPADNALVMEADEPPPADNALVMEADLPEDSPPPPARPAAPPPAAPPPAAVPFARIAVGRPAGRPGAATPLPARPGAATPLPARPGAATPLPARPGAATPLPARPGAATPLRARPGAATPLPAGPGAAPPDPARAGAMTPVPAPGARPAARTPTGSPAPDATLAGGMTMADVETLYRRLVHAKRLCGEPVDALRIESLVATINKQAPKIMAEHRCRQVEFTIALKGDKPILKAIPKK